ncbi:unnamed protein product [Rotaria magnacalcarata]
MDCTKSLAQQTRSLIDHLKVRQNMISTQLKTITNDSVGSLKKSKSVTFFDVDDQSNMRASTDQLKPRSILKKQDAANDEPCPLEPFVVNIPENISRIDIDQYLRNVQDQRRKGLNYSYNTDDEEAYADEEIEEQNNESHEIIQKPIEPWNELKHWRSLFDEGNDRDVYNNTLRTSTNEQQVWTTDNVEQIKKRIHERQNMSLKQQRKNTSASPKKHQQQTSFHNRQKVLLGYDVVAGLLDNEKSLLNSENTLSESYLDELVSFRKNNLDSTASYSMSNDADLTDFSKELELVPPDGDQHSHTCIHSYTINDRLFTVPTNPDANGQSRCPICASLRKEPNAYEPQYARVSVPKYRVNRNAYNFRPSKRGNLSDLSIDSVALANHCLAGFNTARIAPLDKSAKSLDLRTESGTQLELTKMSLEDAQRLGSNHDMCETDLRRRSTALRYHMNTLFQERLRRLRKTTNGADNNASIISQIDVR